MKRNHQNIATPEQVTTENGAAASAAGVSTPETVVEGAAQTTPPQRPANADRGEQAPAPRVGAPDRLAELNRLGAARQEQLAAEVAESEQAYSNIPEVPEVDDTLAPMPEGDDVVPGDRITPDGDQVADEIVDDVPEPDVPAVASADEQQYIDIVVNGEKRQIPLEEAKARLQKETNADLMTQQAAERLNQINVRESQLAVREAALQQSITPPDVDEAQTKETLRDLTKRRNEAIVAGDDDAAAELDIEILDTHSKLNRQPVQQPIDVNTAVNRALDQRDITAAYQRATQDPEMSPFLTNPMLSNLVDAESERLMNSSEYMGKCPSYDQIFKDSISNVREGLGALAPAQPKPAEVPVTQRRTVVTKPAGTTPQASSAPARKVAQRKAPPISSAETRANTLAELARGRGQMTR